jgi:predicted GNAT superfamily acetyltransferase
VINGDDPSDRLLVRWDLTGRPRASTAGEDVVVAVPADIESLRTKDPARARRWRLEVREDLGGLMASGVRVAGFDRARGYVLRRAA